MRTKMNREKRISRWINFMRMIFLIGFLLIFTGTGLAINKVKKDKASQEQKESVPQEKSTPSKAEPDKSQREEKATASERKEREPQVEREKKTEGVIKRMTKEDYDYFIDKNKNGIDDRLETTKEKSKTEKSTRTKKKKEPPQ